MAPAGRSSWWWSGSENLRVRRRTGPGAGGWGGRESSGASGMADKDSRRSRVERRDRRAGQPVEASR